MDPTKKPKLDENGVVIADSDLRLTPSDARKIIERFSPGQLLDVLQHAVVPHSDVLDAVRFIADPDISRRKLFIRGLGWDTTTDGLRSLFSTYGELEEAVVILDKATGKSKGFGFVTFKHIDGALLALKEPSKRIDGRVAVTQLAAVGNSGSNTNTVDIALRKIYVANVPPDLPAEKLLAHFSLYGEIEEGPLGFDKQTGKSKGFALFVYKTAEGAQAALVNPVKMVDERQLNCKLAITDGKQGKRGAGPGGTDGVQVLGNPHGYGMGLAPPSSMPGSLGSQYGGPVGLGSYGGYSGVLRGQPPLGNHPPNSSIGVANQAPSSLSGAGGYGSGLGGPYGGYGGAGSTGYGGMGGSGAAGLGGGNGELGGSGGLGGCGGGMGDAGSLYRLQTSAGMPTVCYPDSGHYSLSSSGCPNQHHQPAGASPLPGVPPGAVYPNAPPY